MVVCKRCNMPWELKFFHRGTAAGRDSRCYACRSELNRLRHARILRSRVMQAAARVAVEAACLAFGCEESTLLSRRGGRRQQGSVAEARAYAVQGFLDCGFSTEAAALHLGMSETAVRRARRRGPSV